MAAPNAVNALKKVSLFASLDDLQIDTVAREANERTFADGEVIVRQGETGAAGFWIILDGNVEVRRGPTHLATLGPGEYFGEMALVSDHSTPRSADVVAIDDVHALQLTRWDLRGLILAHPEIALSMLADLADRIRKADEALARR
jgi:CRP-like cAMP-binding protein